MTRIRTIVACQWETPSEDVTFTVDGDPTLYTASVPAGAWRVGLAPTSGLVRDILRALAAALTAAAPGGATFNAALDLDTGRVTLACTVPWTPVDLHTRAVGVALGFLSTPPVPAPAHTAQRPPWYTALLSGAYGGVWEPRRSAAQETTCGGAVVSLAGTLTHWERELRTDAVPVRHGADPAWPWTHMWPDIQHMHALASTDIPARPWSLADVWAYAQGTRVAVALDDAQEVLESTARPYAVGYLRDQCPRPERVDDRWWALVRVRWGLVLPADGQHGFRG